MTNYARLLSPPSWLGEYEECVNTQLAALYREAGSTLDRAAVDALSKGKRVRAILALLWCEAVSGDYEPAVPVAVAYELAHAAALVQDDIIDGSQKRRGEESIVQKYGLADAILTSNALLFHVPRKIAEYSRFNLSAEALCRLFDMLGQSYGAATRGEYLDLEMAKRREVSEHEYEEMIRLKTGALIAASAASGAIVGGGLREDGVVGRAYRFGEWLGMAYQVQDDVLDLMGDERVMGKAIFTDMKGGKRNLVLIHAFKHCSESERNFLVGLLGNHRPYVEEEVERARALFLKHDSVSYSGKIASKYVEEAKNVLASMRENDARDKLLELSDYLASRSY